MVGKSGEWTPAGTRAGPPGKRKDRTVTSQKTQKQTEKKERPYLRVAVISSDAGTDTKASDADFGVILTLGKVYRNRSNAREAAAAWSQKHEIRAGRLVVLQADSENAPEWTLAEEREIGGEYGAATEEMRERAREAEAARSGN